MDFHVWQMGAMRVNKLIGFLILLIFPGTSLALGGTHGYLQLVAKRNVSGASFTTQDFTTFTENDPDSAITITSSSVTFSNLLRGSGAYVYKANSIGSTTDFTHRFVVERTASLTGSAFIYWSVGDSVGRWGDQTDGIGISTYNNELRLLLLENSSETSDAYTSFANSTTYYITVEHSRTGGVNGTGQTTAYIRNGSHTGTLVDTLQIDSAIGEQNSYGYMYAIQTFALTGSYAASGSISNLETQ